MSAEVASGLSVERPPEQCFRFGPLPLEHSLAARRNGQRISLAIIYLKCAGRRFLRLGHVSNGASIANKPKIEPGHRHPAECRSVFGAAYRSLFKALDGPVKFLSCLAIQVMPASKVPFVRFEITSVAANKARGWLAVPTRSMSAIARAISSCTANKSSSLRS